MDDQKSDPLDQGIEGRLLLQKLLPEIPATCWRSIRMHQKVMGVSSHNHPVLPPAIPLALANCRNLHNWGPGSELEVVRVDWFCPLPGPAQHMEQPEERDGQPHADEHLIEVDKDHRQDEGVWRQMLKLESIKLQ
jgi:hypothetical protein